MKKLLLILASGVLVGTASAQQAQQSVVFSGSQQSVKPSQVNGKTPAELANGLKSHKNTGLNGRWYDYADWLTQTYTSDGVGDEFPYMWNDSTSKDIYSGPTLDFNNLASTGNVFDPTWSGFNDPFLYGGQMQITLQDSYSIDSIEFAGFLGFNTATATYTDTIRLGFISGDRTLLQGNIHRVGYIGEMASYGVDTVRSRDLWYDSVKNRLTDATGTGAGALYQDVLLPAASWGDTTADGLYDNVLALSSPLSVPAGFLVGSSLSFKSGNPAAYANNGGLFDTVFTGHTPGTYRYNMFRQFVLFEGSNDAPSFPVYNANDFNAGVYKTLPSYVNGYSDPAPMYVPQWAFTDGQGGASGLQYPFVRYHVVCNNCGIVNVKNVQNNISNVTSYPNPATSEVTVSFNIDNATNVTVNLTNSIGQVVKTQNMGNVQAGKAVFSTTDLASGLYFYTVNANDKHAVGRVVVAH